MYGRAGRVSFPHEGERQHRMIRQRLFTPEEKIRFGTDGIAVVFTRGGPGVMQFKIGVRTVDPANLAKMLPVETVETKPMVIVIGADKGGVGKTTLSRALDDYLTYRALRHQVFDGEYPNGDLKRFIPNAQIIDILKVEDQMTAFDTVEGITMVDVKAGNSSRLMLDLDKVKLLDDVRAGKLDMTLMHVIGPSVASLNEIAEIAKTLGKSVRHVLVKNYINEAGFEQWADDPRFAQTFKDWAADTITIPHLAVRACTQVQKEGMSFYKFSTAGESRMLRGYVGDWLNSVWTEFDRIGLVPAVQ
jgi:hypothetical protein